jgi:Domain of unknown function (DUF4258)
MFERGITGKMVRKVLEAGEMIEDFQDELLAPSRLLLGFQGKRPIHVVVSQKNEGNEMTIVTVYIPSADKWKNHFRSRRS